MTYEYRVARPLAVNHSTSVEEQRRAERARVEVRPAASAHRWMRSSPRRAVPERRRVSGVGTGTGLAVMSHQLSGPRAATIARTIFWN